MFLTKFFSVFVLLYMNILKISCEGGGSLVFAIDDTRSMWNDEIKNGAKAVIETVLKSKSQSIEDFLLVTFNDPDVVLRVKTNSSVKFVESLNYIRPHNYLNPDCPEMSLSGIEKGLLESRDGSYIFVFTNASAKDYNKVDTIKNLCQIKKSQVVFVLTGDCGNPSGKGYTVYEEIASACSEQSFRLETNKT